MFSYEKAMLRLSQQISLNLITTINVYNSVLMSRHIGLIFEICQMGLYTVLRSICGRYTSLFLHKLVSTYRQMHVKCIFIHIKLSPHCYI